MHAVGFTLNEQHLRVVYQPLMARDSDSPWALGEVGHCGVAVDTLADMRDLFANIDLASVSTSMTINGPTAVILSMYIAIAEENGVAPADLAGTIQSDIFKEYQAQKEYIYHQRAHVRHVLRERSSLDR